MLNTGAQSVGESASRKQGGMPEKSSGRQKWDDFAGAKRCAQWRTERSRSPLCRVLIIVVGHDVPVLQKWSTRVFGTAPAPRHGASIVALGKFPLLSRNLAARLSSFLPARFLS